MLAEQVRSFDDLRPASLDSEEIAPDSPRPRLPIFRRARQARIDRARRELEEVVRELERERVSHVAGESRLLLDGLGRDGLRLYAVPTTRGEVSYYLASGRGDLVSGSGAPALSEGLAWHISYQREPGGGMHVVVFGLVANDVERVEIELKKSRRLAVAENNGFFYEGTDHEPDDVRAVITYSKAGASRRVALA